MKTFTKLAQWASKCASLSTSNKKRYYLFIIMFLMLGVGNAWGQTTVYTETFEDASYTTSTTYNNSTEKKHGPTNYQWGVLCGTPNTGAHNGSKAFAMRYYKSVAKTPTLTQYFDINSVDRITFWAKTESTNNTLNIEYSTNGGSSWSSLASNISVTTLYKEYTYDFPTQQSAVRLRFTMGTTTEKKSMFIDDVAFIKVSSGSEPETPVASLTVNPTTIDFGTVYEGATVADKTVAVNFANLTGNVTYSGLSTPFTAKGTVSNDGDKITIAANTATIGEYSQTLTITSAADSKTAKVTVKMNVVEKPAPTGTFTLHTGELIEGDYVIYYSGKAMKAEVASDRLQYVEVTPSNNEIVDPAAAAIWHIAKSGANWTVYNNNKGYAAGTGTKSEAGLVANLTGDNANKAAWTVTASGNAYEFVNVWNTSKAVNATLRNNGTYGFACYATSTGGALSLYRKAGTKYNVTVSSTTNGSVTASPTSAEAGTTITLTVTPETGYVLDDLTVTDASSNPVTVTDNKFTMPASNVTVTATFKENEKPAATLTLSKNGVEEPFPGSWKQDDVVTLPTTVDTDCVKEFVGWSADANCATAPEYAPGASYTLASTTQTLYAVYATVEGGGETTSEDIFENNGTYNDTDPATIDWTLQNVVSIVQEQASSTSPVSDSYIKDPRWYKSHVITITPSVNITKIVTQAQSNDYATALAGSTYTNATATASKDVVTIIPNDGNEKITIKMGAQARLYTLTVTYAAAATYSNYSTTCSAALTNPTVSLAEGKYTEAKSVEITATEGTVYYTTDGTTPTASSTQYTGAIALNDCGEYTIKAIAISSDSQSDVVSATYTIKLPLTNSQAAPYTEAEAIAVYDGGCYDNQDVYVKGTVKTATFNSTYGNYTITLTNGFQFYRFLQAAETKFTEDIIVPGDVLVACGKLSKYNTTYQLAEGCYLVEHEPYTEPKTDISNTEATAYTVDKAFELIEDVKSDLTKEVYVKGLVAVAPTSNPTADGQMTYKISDNGENTGNVLTVYLGLNLNGEKFTSKNDVQQGDYVVVKGKLLDYNSTYELNKGNQLVQHVKAATISIADITMEVGETKTIAATITPAAAETAVVYTIKENTDNAISLSGNTITANAVGTATITATIATAAEYMGKTVEFKVTVTPKSTKQNVVILAEYNGKWYAMTNECTDNKQMGALEVDYQNGVLFEVDEATKATITWELAIVDGKATFKNSNKYLIGGNSTNLNFANSKFEWTVESGKYLSDSKSRTFLYNKGGIFKNYDISNAEPTKTEYSGYPVVAVPVYVTSEAALTGKFSTGKYEYAQFAPGNLQYNVGSSTWAFAGEQYNVIGEPNINVGDPTFTGTIDMFGWSTDNEGNNLGVNPSMATTFYTGNFVDWGTLFPVADNYSTLSHDQWNYLLNSRANASSLKQIAYVGSVFGVMLFPDNWIYPDGCKVEKTLNHDDADGERYDFYSYNYTLDQWTELEAAGAVFLPAAGRRFGGVGNTYNSDGVETSSEIKVQHATNGMACYWTGSKHDDGVRVSSLFNLQVIGENDFKYNTLSLGWFGYGNIGQSVRLAKVTSTIVEISEGDNTTALATTGVVDVKVNRQFTKDALYTIALPFALDNAASVFGTASKVYEYAALRQDGEGVVLDFKLVDDLESGKPYLVQPSQDVTCFIVDDVTLSSKANNITFTAGITTITMEAILSVAANTKTAGKYWLAENKYLYNNEVPLPGLRAVFDLSTKSNAPVRARVALGGETATNLEGVAAPEGETKKVIVNGQLFIIRNGEIYNLQGMRL